MKIAYSISDLCLELGMGRTKIYALINDRKIVAHKIGSRTVVLRKDLEQFISTLPSFEKRE